MAVRVWAVLACCAMSAGCGTTKWSDTRRTATEQLLISDSMDRAVSNLDFRALAGKKAYLDSTPLKGVTDSAYLVSLLRQHMLAEGCRLMEDRQQADYVVEVRAGAVGTDRREVVFGVPAAEIPEVIPVQGVPARIPEMPLAKKTEQRAVTKLAVFAYNRLTGRPVWQSGVVPVESKAKDVWVLGAGPFQRGTIYEGTKFAGDNINIPLITPGNKEHGKLGEVSVASQAFFSEPNQQLAEAATQGNERPAGGGAEPKVAGKKGSSEPSEGVIHAGYAAPRAAPQPDRPPQPTPGAAPIQPPPRGPERTPPLRRPGGPASIRHSDGAPEPTTPR